MAAKRLLVLLMMMGFFLAGYGAWMYRDAAVFTEADIEVSAELNTLFDEQRARQSDDPVWRDEPREERQARIEAEIRDELATAKKQATGLMFSGAAMLLMCLFTMLATVRGRKASGAA